MPDTPLPDPPPPDPPPPDPTTQAIALAWPAIEASLDPLSWPAFSARLLALLRALDAPDADRAALHQRIDALFAEAPAAQAVLRRAAAPATVPPKSVGAGGGGGISLGSPWATRGPGGGGRPPAAPASEAPAAPPAAAQRHTLISVLYGTDRTPVDGRSERAAYTDEPANALHFGAATVSIPDDHVKGRLERPRWYRLEFRDNADKHVVITSMGALSSEAFVAEATAARRRDGSADEALIFVHGYRVGFEDSILRTAQFAVDLEFRGLAIAYSWPSKASLFGYGADANVSETSMFMLAKFIELVRSRLGLQRVHVVAHSMGSRVLARALNQHTLALPEAAPAGLAELNQVVFAAPDIDPTTFANFAEVFTRSCERCTLYASSHDLALTASKWIYQRHRSGDTSAAALVTHGVDTIDASDVDHSLVGHSYFSDRRTVLADLHELLEHRREPGLRYGLNAVAVGGGRYWAFKA